MFPHGQQYAHWHHFFENIPISSLEFYTSLEEELTERKVPQIKVARLGILEGSLLSSKRIYLKVQRDWMTYHICVAPFGTGFFVSSRLLLWRWKGLIKMAIITAATPFVILLLHEAMPYLFTNVAISFLFTIGFILLSLIFLFFLWVIWFFSCLRVTYYRRDTMLAFHEAVHRLLVAQINLAIEPSGHRPLTETESKPILHKLLQK